MMSRSFVPLARSCAANLALILVAIITAASGFVNLYAVIGSDRDQPLASVRGLFPLCYLNASRSATLLAGFALIVSSLNILRRKRRAYLLVLALSAFSLTIHILTGMANEGAVASIILLAVLIACRRPFIVRSRRPDLRLALMRTGVAALVVLTYGIGGFWLLDPREFGVNFHLWDAVQWTLACLTPGADGIVARTRYAEWFLQSLTTISWTFLFYAAWVLFRPVLHQFRVNPVHRARAVAILAEHGRCAQDYFKVTDDKSFFFSNSGRSFVAYRVAAGIAVVLGDPVGPEDDLRPVIEQFLAMCTRNGWRAAFHQASPEMWPVYSSLHLRKFKIGDEAIVDLTRFTVSGRSMREFRNAFNRLDKQGIRTRYVEAPLPEDVLAQLQEVSDEWLRNSGRRERQFTLGRFDLEYIRTTPVFVAVDQAGRVLAFVNIIPSFRKGEMNIDLMRRRADAPNNIMDLLLGKLFLYGREGGYRSFNLGMAPMAGFRDDEDASLQERVVHTAVQKASFVFAFRGIRDHKAKLASYWEPRYVVYRGALDLPLLAMALVKVCEART